MLGAALALIVIGLIAGVVAFPFGFAPAVLGVAVLVVYLVGAARRTTDA